MTKQTESFSFDEPLEVNEKWMMGVTNLKVYNTVYNITPTSNKHELLLTEQQLKEHGIDTELVQNDANLYETSNDKFVEKINTRISNSYSTKSKPTRKDFKDIKRLIEVLNYPDQQINMLPLKIKMILL